MGRTLPAKRMLANARALLAAMCVRIFANNSNILASQSRACMSVSSLLMLKIFHRAKPLFRFFPRLVGAAQILPFARKHFVSAGYFFDHVHPRFCQVFRWADLLYQMPRFVHSRDTAFY